MSNGTNGTILEQTVSGGAVSNDDQREKLSW